MPYQNPGDPVFSLGSVQSKEGCPWISPAELVVDKGGSERINKISNGL